jgi:hypothetical protein
VLPFILPRTQQIAGTEHLARGAMPQLDPSHHEPLDDQQADPPARPELIRRRTPHPRLKPLQANDQIPFRRRLALSAQTAQQTRVQTGQGTAAHRHRRPDLSRAPALTTMDLTYPDAAGAPESSGVPPSSSPAQAPRERPLAEVFFAMIAPPGLQQVGHTDRSDRPLSALGECDLRPVLSGLPGFVDQQASGRLPRARGCRVAPVPAEVVRLADHRGPLRRATLHPGPVSATGGRDWAVGIG